MSAPETDVPSKPSREQLLEARGRILAKVKHDPETGCQIWQGGPGPDGYGQISCGGRKWSAHRLIYEADKGPIPDGHLVRHTCNRPLCVNPDHLVTGTHQDNMNDMKISERAAKNKGPKLSDKEVVMIHGLHFFDELPQGEIANMLGVSRWLVSAICNERSHGGRAEAIEHELERDGSPMARPKPPSKRARD